MVNEIFVRVFEICNKHCALFHDNRWVKRILHWNPGGGRPQQFFSNGKLAYKILASGISWVTGFMLPKTRMLQCHHPNVLRLQPLKQRAGNAGYAVVQELSLFLFPPLILENFVWIVLSSGTSTGNDPNPPVIMSAECLLTRSMSRSVVTVVRLRMGLCEAANCLRPIRRGMCQRKTCWPGRGAHLFGRGLESSHHVAIGHRVTGPYAIISCCCTLARCNGRPCA